MSRKALEKYRSMRDFAATPEPSGKPRKLSNPDKVLFPDVGVTKQGLLDYCRSVADRMLPHVVGRPLMVLRCPDGVGGMCFYQKHPAADGRGGAVGGGRTDDEQWLSIGGLGGLEALV